MGDTILAGTGHRPNKILIDGANGYDRIVDQKLIGFCMRVVDRIRPTHGISGMALGFDQALAEAFCRLGIPWTAAIPFVGQESRWPRQSQRRYHELLAKASRKVVVCEGAYAPWKMDARNRWMVDHCTDLGALHDGSEGGTGNCVAYADQVNRNILRLWPEWLDFIRVAA